MKHSTPNDTTGPAGGDAWALELRLARDRVATKRVKLDVALRHVVAARRELAEAHDALRRVTDRCRERAHGGR